MRTLYLFMTLCLILIMILAACGRDRNKSEGTSDSIFRYSGQIGLTSQVFTVVGPLHLTEIINSTADTLFESNEDIEFNFIGLPLQIINEEMDAVFLDSIAGNVPDIIISISPMYRFIQHGILSDIYDILDNSDTISRADFFQNVLEAFEISGSLYTIPLEFTFQFVGINTNLPSSILRQFYAFNQVNVIDMINIYLELIENYPQFENFAFAYDLGITHFGTWRMLIDNLNYFTDVTATSANIDVGKLENFLYVLKQIYEKQIHDDVATDSVQRENHVFFYARHGLDVASSLFMCDNSLFIHHIPFADLNDRLIVNTPSVTHTASIGVTADKPLALNFIYNLQGTYSTLFGNVEIPIVKSRFQEKMENVFIRAVENAEQHQRSAITANQMYAAITRLKHYTNMPLSAPITRHFLPTNLILNSFSMFITGENSASETVSFIEEQFLGLFFANEHLLVEDTEIDQSYDDEIPTYTLSVLAREDFIWVIRQAETAMAQEWLKRPIGEKANFKVEISSYQMQNRDQTITRMQTMLMAGQGYDMFFWNGVNLVQWARSGFLIDIYNLLDTDPNTNLEDFFTEPLAAIEIDGGLYAFPVSFGYYYVQINENLPPSIINRFNVFNRINMLELMNIYATLVQDYGSIFSNFSFIEGMGLNSVVNVMLAQMGGYIDFNKRISNITNPSFIDFLNVLRIAYDGSDPNYFSGMKSFPFFSYGTRINFSQSYAFIAESSFLGPGNAFIDSPVFTNGIPLTDNLDRLIIDQGFISPSTWASICFPVAGNSTLAWEFTQHLVAAFSQPIGRAQHWNTTNPWGRYSLSSPILRHLFQDHITSAFDNFYTYASALGLLKREEREWSQLVDTAIDRLLLFNEMPMAIFLNHIPQELVLDNFLLFWNGLITAEEFANRANNSISLWLIE